MRAGSKDPTSSMTLIVALIGTICLLAIVVLAQVLFYNMQRIQDESKLFAPKPQALLDLQYKQAERISEYRYIDREKGVVAIPIDQAIALYVARQKSPGAAPTIERPESDQAERDSSGQTP